MTVPAFVKKKAQSSRLVAPNYEVLERNISELREWKDDLRDKIENAKTHTSNFERFSEHLAQSSIEFSSKRQNVS